MPARAAPSGRCTVRAHFLCLDSINTTSGDRGHNPQGQGSVTTSAPPLVPRSQQKAPQCGTRLARTGKMVLPTTGTTAIKMV